MNNNETNFLNAILEKTKDKHIIVISGKIGSGVTKVTDFLINHLDKEVKLFQTFIVSASRQISLKEALEKSFNDTKHCYKVIQEFKLSNVEKEVNKLADNKKKQINVVFLTTDNNFRNEKTTLITTFNRNNFLIYKAYKYSK